MTKEELQKRIEKKENDVKKIEKRITKWTRGMKPEAVEVVKVFGALSYGSLEYSKAFAAYKAYKASHANDPEVENEYFTAPSISEAYQAYRDLQDATATMQKYQTQLATMNNFQEAEKIQVIWDFLRNWRKEAYDYYINNIKLYCKLKQEYKEKFNTWVASQDAKEYLDSMKNYPEWKKEWMLEKSFDKKYYAPISNLVIQLTTNPYHSVWDDKKLNDILDKDVRNKYEDFIKRISEKAGNIKDVSQLKMAPNGIINGVVVGDKARVRVETITAGGYNAGVIVNVKHGQILHYRVLVQVIA